MNPPGQASLVEIALKSRRGLDRLAARFADRAPHAFYVHRVQFAAWLEHWSVLETDRVDMTLDYQVRNKLEAGSELHSELRLMLSKISSCEFLPNLDRKVSDVKGLRDRRVVLIAAWAQIGYS